MEEVILVDEFDNPIGTMEKLEAHGSGQLHRAFSILIFNSKGQLLLQKRAESKYHSGGLWTNTCCSHPRPDENTDQAAKRRLEEEMGLSADLQWCFSFQYEIDFDNGLTEHELDHVFIGKSDSTPEISNDEASDYKYVDLAWLKVDMKENPSNYTHWFGIIMSKLDQHYEVVKEL
ncbi:MAG: isopentenyl-diphosphate Delta-isomerase [Cyclobacteriaceae bacterium]